MSSSVSFGTNVNAQRKRVKFVNSNSSATVVVYEGMPLNYEFDTTANVLGYDKGNSVNGATTAEGYQNEGKFMLVDLPAGDNITYFAGVVAHGSWCGKSVADDGELWLEIFIPNGAIVPVRSDVDTTVGQTILSIRAASQELESVTGGSGWNRPVAIAMEDETGLDSAAGITLAKLCPEIFIWQDGNDGDGLHTGTSTDDLVGGMALNRINVVSKHTSGSFCAFEIKSESGVATSSYGLALMARSIVTDIISEPTCAVGIRLNVTGGVQSNNLSALRVQLTESGVAQTDVSGIFSVMNLVNQFTHNPDGSHQWIYLENDGSYPPDYLFYAKYIADIPMAAKSGTCAVSHVIPIRVLGTTYYIMVTDEA